MNKRIKILTGAFLAGTASASTTLLAHPGASQHPAVTGPLHGLVHTAAAATVLLAAGVLVAALIWMAARARVTGPATEQE